MSFRWIFQLLNKLWIFLSFLFKREFRRVVQYQPVKYDLYPLSPGKHFGLFNLSEDVHENFCFLFPVSRHRLSLVQRKTLVLDLDETLIHSHHDGLPRNPSIKPGTPHDFTVSLCAKINFSFIKIHRAAVELCVKEKEEVKKIETFTSSSRQ
jgi:CTD nuclear envelope phosphatase 1